MIQFAFGTDCAFQVGDDFVHIGEAEAEPFDIVHIAGRYTIEFFENLFQVFFLDADAVVLYRDDDFVAFGGGFYHQFEGNPFAGLFYGIVEQVEDDVGEVHFIDFHQAVFGIEFGVDAAAKLFDFQFECA